MHLFDQGWNALREQIIANQKRLRVIPANTQLTPWPDDLAKWETLSADEKKLFAHQADDWHLKHCLTGHPESTMLRSRRASCDRSSQKPG
jgi:arylsulfatase